MSLRKRLDALREETSPKCLKCEKTTHSKTQVCAECRKHPCRICKKMFIGYEQTCSTCFYKIRNKANDCGTDGNRKVGTSFREGEFE